MLCFLVWLGFCSVILACFYQALILLFLYSWSYYSQGSFFGFVIIMLIYSVWLFIFFSVFLVIFLSVGIHFILFNIYQFVWWILIMSEMCCYSQGAKRFRASWDCSNLFFFFASENLAYAPMDLFMIIQLCYFLQLSL